MQLAARTKPLELIPQVFLQLASLLVMIGASLWRDAPLVRGNPF